MREIGKFKFDSSTHTDRNMLMRFEIAPEAVIDRNLTYLWGYDNGMFPLLSLTQGNGAMMTKKLINAGDTQYSWPIADRIRVTSRIVKLVSATTTPGKDGTSIEVEMEDNWFIYQHTAISPSGYRWRIQNDGVATGSGTYIYRFSPMGGTNAAAPLSDFRAGLAWALGASSIPTSKSDGNRSNAQAPMNATNQYGLYRFSMPIAGNMENAVVQFSFDTESGGTKDYWIPYEVKEWEIKRKMMLEEDLWFSEYNRDINGVIHLKDEHTGEVVPKGAGVYDILNAVGNVESYSVLTLERINRIVDRIFDARTDYTVDELVLYCGKGFFREFDKAVKRDAQANNYFFALSGEEIRNGGKYLSYGAYFNQYRMSNGKTLTLKQVDIFDRGIRAEQERINGQTYNGLPISSYNGVFLDHSLTGNGDRNIQFVAEEGREFQVGIYKGMATIPAMWDTGFKSMIADRQDIASYEVLGSQGINMKNPYTSFWLKKELE